MRTSRQRLTKLLRVEIVEPRQPDRDGRVDTDDPSRNDQVVYANEQDG